MIHYSDLDMSSNRETFISSGEIPESTVREEIIASWKRSKDLGINPRMAELPQLVPIEIVKKGYEERFSKRTQVTLEVMQKFYDFLEYTGLVLFGTDTDLTILVQRGCRKLLAELNAKNIGLGASLREDVIGTNAAALALHYKTEVNVIGAEHYIEALQDYACSAVCSYNEKNELFAVNMLVAPKDNFNPYQLGMLSQFTQLLLAGLITHSYKTESALLYDHVNLLIAQNDIGLILVNYLGNVLRINKPVMDIFGVEEADVYGKKFEKVFPELEFAAACLKSGRSIYNQEVYCLRHPQIMKTLKIECHTAQSDPSGQNQGMIITIQEKKKEYRQGSPKTSFTARYTFDDLVGQDPAFVAVKKAAEKSAAGSSNTLIIGESGTGKELLAQAIHNAGSRANRPFISVNCAAIPKELIGSELFGYVEGAFTGARKNGAPGKFELADQGTLFLDEIGEMPLEMQSVLLRVLEDKTVTRLGASSPIPVDVKVISATNRDLWQLVENKQFRLDLYFRLNVIRLELPPLRERKEDIPLLIDYYLQEIGPRLRKTVQVSPEAVTLLMNYSWPGNVRELRNALESAISLCDSDILTPGDLPKEILLMQAQSAPQLAGSSADRLLDRYLKSVAEQQRMLDLMQKYKGNKSRVAKELGITRAALYRRLKTLTENNPLEP